MPLKDALALIENSYNLKFTYADSTIEGKTIQLPNQIILVEELISYIEERTGLNLHALNNYQIIIQKKEENTHEIQFLKEVTVTNYLTKGIALNNGGITSIKPNSFGILPGLIEPDVLLSLQALPGIQSVDERVSNLNIRGGTHDQNLILWDGIKMYQSGHFFGLISAFNPYLTQDVLVSKNGTSALYGDGVSGIIDMRSSNTVNDLFWAGFGLNLINADGFAKIPLHKKTALHISARRSITDIVNTPTYDKYFDRIFQDSDITNTTMRNEERFYFYDLSAKLLHDFSANDKLSFSFLQVYNNLNYKEESDANNTNLEELESELIQQNLALGLKYEKKWHNKLSSTLQIYSSKYNLDATNIDLVNSQQLKQENEVLDLGLKLSFGYRLEKNLNYLGGYQINEVGITNFEHINNPSFSRFSKNVLITHAIFNEIKFNSDSKKTNARIGLRTNYYDKFSELTIEPRISFSQKLSNAIQLEVLGELKSQITSQIIDLQNDFLGVEKRRWVLSNNEDEIPIIKSKQFSVGFQYNKNKFTASLEGYIKQVDGITSQSQGFQNQYQFIQTNGSYSTKGIDLLINKQFDHFSTWLSYSYSDNNYTFKNLNFNNEFPNNANLKHSITFASTYSIKKLKLALGLNWRTGKPLTHPNALNPQTNTFINYDLPNASNLNEYFRIDLSTIYTFNLGSNSKAYLGASLINLLNKKNIINTYYRLDDTGTLEKVENVALKFTPNISFRCHF